MITPTSNQPADEPCIKGKQCNEPDGPKQRPCLIGCQGKGTPRNHNHQDDDRGFLPDVGEVLLQRIRTYQGGILGLMRPRF